MMPRHETEAASRGRHTPQIVTRLLRLPLFYKILLANSVFVGLVSLLLAWLASRGPATPGATALVAVGIAGTALGTGLNAAVIWLALQPLRLLRETAERIDAGHLDERVPGSPLADRDMERLRHATNGMLDRLEGYRLRLREVAQRALAAAEEERRRISRELHDDTSQRLAALLIRLRVARRTRSVEDKDVLLEEVRSELGAVAEAVRRYAWGLRPPALDQLGLGAAIHAYARQLGGIERAPRYEVTTPRQGRLEDPAAELALYRIVQEALSNTARHSRATRVHVALSLEGDTATAVIRDDGVGFDSDRLLGDPRSTRGLGLLGMRERAEYVGGRLDIRSRPGAGTVVKVEIPVEQPPGSSPGDGYSAFSRPVWSANRTSSER